MNKLLFINLFLIVNLLGINTVFGQIQDSTSRVEVAFRHAKKMKEGVLVVRLETKARTINALQRTVDNPKLQGKARIRMETALKNKIEERDSINQEVFEAFKYVYKYSDFVFMYDTSTTRLKNGELQGYFYNENQSLDPSISLEGKNYYITYIGETDRDTNIGLKAFVINDKYLNELDAPFPTYVKFSKFLGKKKAKSAKKQKLGLFKGHTIEEAVGKLNDVFFAFYEKHRPSY